MKLLFISKKKLKIEIRCDDERKDEGDELLSMIFVYDFEHIEKNSRSSVKEKKCTKKIPKEEKEIWPTTPKKKKRNKPPRIKGNPMGKKNWTKLCREKIEEL